MNSQREIFRAVGPMRMLSIIGLIGIGGFACATTGKPDPQLRPATPPTAEAARFDEDALALVEELVREDFAAVTTRFASKMRSALPPEKLAGTWRSILGSLGEVKGGPEIVARDRKDGYEIRQSALYFENVSLLVTVAFDGSTHEVGGLFFRPGPKRAEPEPDEAEEKGYRIEEVKVGSAPFVLDGTLTIPTAGDRFPAVVLVQGSGPNDRDSSIGPNRPLKDLAEGLASRGVAVLRYDKRTFRYGDRLTNAITIDEEVVLDAIAAVELLKSRAEIDPSRIFVVGHSLGALLAPEIAERAGAVAGAVMLAPSGRAPWESILMQFRYLGAPAETIAEVEKAAVRLAAGDTAVTLLGVPGAYWKDWASRDGVAAAKRLGKPLLILRGDRDYQVTEEDIATWRTGLAGHPGLEIETIEGANHLFIKGSGKPGPQEYMVPGTVAEEVIEKVASFVLPAR